MEEDYCDGTEDPNNIVSTEEHLQLAREIVAKSTVLLENKDDLLPLDVYDMNIETIVVIGDNSTIAGGGSGSVSPSVIVTHAMGLELAFAEVGRGTTGNSNSKPNSNSNNNTSNTPVNVIYNDGLDLEVAMALAATADIVVVVVGVTSCEGSDRDTLSMGDKQNTLVSSIADMESVREKGQ